MKTFAIIDDEPTSLLSLSESVINSEIHKSYQAVYTTDPNTILEWVRGNQVDAVVSDFNLNRQKQDSLRDGLELLKEIRKIDDEIPEILFSAVVGVGVDKSFTKDLKDHNIRFIHKSDKDLLFDQIINVLSKSPVTKNSLNNHQNNRENSIVNIIKDIYLDNLKKSNSTGIEILIPNSKTGITDSKIDISKLIDEVQRMTPLGISFLENWIKGKYLAESVRNSKKSFWKKIFNSN